MKRFTLNIEELEQRIAPGASTADLYQMLDMSGESSGNVSNEASNNASPRPGAKTAD